MLVYKLKFHGEIKTVRGYKGKHNYHMRRHASRFEGTMYRSGRPGAAPLVKKYKKEDNC